MLNNGASIRYLNPQRALDAGTSQRPVADGGGDTVGSVGGVGMTQDKLIGTGVGFERIRRITGYLVGTIERFNDAKKAEVNDRVAHCVGTNMEELK